MIEEAQEGQATSGRFRTWHNKKDRSFLSGVWLLEVDWDCAASWCVQWKPWLLSSECVQEIVPLLSFFDPLTSSIFYTRPLLRLIYRNPRRTIYLNYKDLYFRSATRSEWITSRSCAWFMKHFSSDSAKLLRDTTRYARLKLNDEFFACPDTTSLVSENFWHKTKPKVRGNVTWE